MRRVLLMLVAAGLLAGARDARAQEPVDLTGTWTAQDLDSSPLVSGSTITLNVAADGTVTGNATCNRFRASVTQPPGTLVFAPVVATRLACPPAHMAQESQFLELLGAMRHAELQPDGRLRLSAPDGRTLTWRRGRGRGGRRSGAASDNLN